MFDTIVDHLNIMSSTTHASSTYARPAFGVFGSNFLKERHYYIQSCVFTTCRYSRLALPMLAKIQILCPTSRAEVSPVVKIFSFINLHYLAKESLPNFAFFLLQSVFCSRKFGVQAMYEILRFRGRTLQAHGPMKSTSRLPGDGISYQIAIEKKPKRRS